MQDEVNEYIESRALLLNGQLRGAINNVARDMNKELINLTLGDIFGKGYDLGKAVQANAENLDQLKAELGIPKDTQLKMDFDGR